MGCSSSHDSCPLGYVNPELEDLKIGSRRQSLNGCGPSIGGGQAGGCRDHCVGSKTSGFSWPQKGEYAWGGQGDDCKLCSFDVSNRLFFALS